MRIKYRFVIQRALDMKGGGEEPAFEGAPNSEWYSRSSTLVGQGYYRLASSIAYMSCVQSCWTFLKYRDSVTKMFQ